MPWHVVLLLATGQTIAYLRCIKGMLKRHEEVVRSSCSTVDTITLGWLRWRIVAYGVIWGAGIAGMAVPFVNAPAPQQGVMWLLVMAVLAGLSRKSMLGAITGRPARERAVASAAAALIAVQRGASIVRVHDVAATVDAIKIWQAIREADQQEPGGSG